MPVVTFTLLKGQPATLKNKLGHAVHLALENAGVRKADRFQRLARFRLSHLFPPSNLICDLLSFQIFQFKSD
jgi:hypothetical protein